MKITTTIHSAFRAFLLLLCCGFITGPQITLQLSAWGWMIASYSQESSLEQAIRETFGGDRPCELCRIIEKTEDRSQQQIPESGTPESREIKLMLGLAQKLTIQEQTAAPQGQTAYLRQALDAHRMETTPPPRNLA